MSLLVLQTSMIQYGADRVMIAEHHHLQAYTPDGYLQAIMQVLEAEKPEGFILGHTSVGKDISPRIAAKLKSGLISDVVSLEVMEKRLFLLVRFTLVKLLRRK